MDGEANDGAYPIVAFLPKLEALSGCQHVRSVPYRTRGGCHEGGCAHGLSVTSAAAVTIPALLASAAFAARMTLLDTSVA